MHIQDIRNFCETGIYKHVKATEPRNTMPMEQLVRYAHDKYYANKNIFSTIKDSHKFSSSNGCVEIPLGQNAKYDGIYDIWLLNCVGVVTITLCFGEDIEIPIPEFKLKDDISIQIPLAFCTEGKEVTQMFADIQGNLRSQNHNSFIPSVAFVDQKLTIKLNDMATCDAVISTVYFSDIDVRRRLANYTNKFYINGEPFVTTWGGKVQLAPEKSSGGTGCVIC